MSRRLALAIALSLVPATAAAQDVADLPPPSDLTGALTTGVHRARKYWDGSGPTRPFLSAVLDLGVVHFRPTLAAGYGKPHYEWIGVETGGGISLSGTRYYAGIRGVLPIVDLRIGARYELPVEQYFLPPQDSYQREELETERTAPQRYIAGEGELTTSWPMPGGSMFLVGTGYVLGAVESPYYIFEEALKVVAAPPFMWRGRLGYLGHIGWLGTMKLGGAAEVIHLVAREAAVVRAGPLVSVALTHHLEASAGIMIVAYSPDDLGIVGADLGQLGVRYRWATGDRFPEFP